MSVWAGLGEAFRKLAGKAKKFSEGKSSVANFIRGIGQDAATLKVPHYGIDTLQSMSEATRLKRISGLNSQLQLGELTTADHAARIEKVNIAHKLDAKGHSPFLDKMGYEPTAALRDAQRYMPGGTENKAMKEFLSFGTQTLSSVRRWGGIGAAIGAVHGMYEYSTGKSDNLFGSVAGGAFKWGLGAAGLKTAMRFSKGVTSGILTNGAISHEAMQSIKNVSGKLKSNGQIGSVPVFKAAKLEADAVATKQAMKAKNAADAAAKAQKEAKAAKRAAKKAAKVNSTSVTNQSKQSVLPLVSQSPQDMRRDMMLRGLRRAVGAI